ncbi:MAG: hypothetical protein WCK49_01510 [Myxococcaceae bacterium]
MPAVEQLQLLWLPLKPTPAVILEKLAKMVAVKTRLQAIAKQMISALLIKLAKVEFVKTRALLPVEQMMFVEREELASKETVAAV